jgi:hypothetical protein
MGVRKDGRSGTEMRSEVREEFIVQFGNAL